MIRFESKTGSSISMLEQDAKHLLELMQHRTDVPGTILAQDVDAHLDHLRSAVRDEASIDELSETSPEDSASEENTEIPITLSTRAYPLIKLLETAQINQEAVIWDHDSSII